MTQITNKIGTHGGFEFGIKNHSAEYRFIALWAVVTDAWGYSSYLFSSDNGVYYYGYISRFVWEVPAVLLTVIKYFIAGCAEEIVFRGWRYNALAKVLSNRKSVAISALMFVLLHWPAYFIRLFRFGTFDCADLLVQSYSALLWGILTCWLMRRSRTLWDPILVHFAYNLSCIMLIRVN